MTRRKRSILQSLLLPSILCMLGILDASDADAQVRRGRAQDTSSRWAPVSIGVRFGYDQAAQGELLGGQLRIPLTRSGVVELVTFADVIFPVGTKEHQYSAEVVWIPGGARAGGIFGGGGLGWRDTVLASTNRNDPRATHFGYSVVVGVKSKLGPIELEVDIRWIYLNDTRYRPNPVSLGLNYPLWSVRPAGSR